MFIAAAQTASQKNKPKPSSTNDVPPFPLWVMPQHNDWQEDKSISDTNTLELKYIAHGGELGCHQIITSTEWAKLTRHQMDKPITSPHYWLASAEWQGVSLKTLWEYLTKTDSETIPSSAAITPTLPKYLIQRNASGHTQPLRLTDELINNSLVADTVNNKPLPFEWGGPYWLVISDRYHTLGCEQLTELWWTDTPPRLPSRQELLAIEEAVLRNIAPGKYFNCTTNTWKKHS